MFETNHNSTRAARVQEAFDAQKINTINPEGPISHTHETMRSASQLADRIEALRDRLVGSQPAQATQNGLNGVNSSVSVFSDLTSHSSRVQERISDANFALDQIERGLA